MKKLSFLLVVFAFGSYGYCQIVTIPDAAFKNYLLAQPTINLNSDAEIQVSEANAFSGSIGCFNLGIFDLTGIEAFTNLSVLAVPLNSISSLDVSQNTQLETLICPMNNLTSLDVSNNLILKELVFSDNNVTAIDVTQNPLLTRLEFYSNSITSIDISQNPLLEWFDCSGNSVGNLDFSIHPNLERLVCNGTYMTVLDVSNNPLLTYLELMVNDVSSIDLSANTALEVFRADFNEMTSLDLFMCPNLYTFGCFACDNLLTINLASGSNPTLTNFQANNSPNISCVQVDDVAFAVANWTLIDDNSVFSLNCLLENEEMHQPEELSLFPNPFSDHLTIRSDGRAIQSVEIVNGVGQIVANYSLSVGQYEFQMDLVTLESGYYVVTVVSEDGLISRTFPVLKD